MSCGSSGPCSCTPGCPKAAAVANSLGFTGVPACCAAPCPAFPFIKVNICINLNQSTEVRIRQGCRRAPLTRCADIGWEWGKTMDTGLANCGIVNWNRTVKNGTFLNVQFCNRDACAPCGSSISSCGRRLLNQLVRFQVDGVEYRWLLEAILANPPDSDALEAEGLCYYVRCTGAATGCCSDATFTSLGNIPAGAEIVFGPLGVPFPQYLITPAA